MQNNGVFEIIPGQNDQGEHVFCVIAKRSYRIVPGAALQRLDADYPLRQVDEYYDRGDPEWSTVEQEYELAPFKPLTDVVVVGKAYAPGDKPVSQMSVSVKVGRRIKSINVFGDRECQFCPGKLPKFTEPKPFTEMEIRYDRAYGGRDEKSVPDIPFFYPRNYMGTGVVLRNTKESIDGLMLPNLEDPNDLLTPERVVLEKPEDWPKQPMPQGFGWLQRTWYPRCTYVGAFPAFADVDTVTPEEHLGLVPQDHIALAKQFRLPSFDARFNNGASLGMTYTALAPDETIALKGFTAEGDLEFSLPGETPEIVLDIGRGESLLEVVLHTVNVRPDGLEVDLIWRGAQVYEGYSWWPQMKRLYAEVS